MVIEKGPKKTVIASSKLTPCFLKFVLAFSSSHSKFNYIIAPLNHTVSFSKIIHNSPDIEFYQGNFNNGLRSGILSPNNHNKRSLTLRLITTISEA